MPEITIAEMISCAKRELAYRRRTYPHLVARNRLSGEEADREIATMRAILHFLERHNQSELSY